MAYPTLYADTQTATKSNGTTAATQSRASTAHENTNGALVSVSTDVIRTLNDGSNNYLDTEIESETITRNNESLNLWSTTNGLTSWDLDNAGQGAPVTGKFFDGFISTAVNELHYFAVSTVQTPSATRHCFSIFAKPGAVDWCRIFVSNGSTGNKGYYFDTTNGVLGSAYVAGGTLGVEGGLIDCGSGVYRVWVSPLDALSAAATTLYVYMHAADAVTTFTGDATNISGWFFGPQMEATTYPTSYIGPTTTAAITRAADVHYWTGDDGNLGGVGSEKQATVKLKTKIPDQTIVAAKRILALTDGGASADTVDLQVNTDGYAQVVIDASGGTTRTVIGPSTDIADGAEHDVQVAYRPGRCVVYVDGVGGTPATNVIATDVPDNLDRIEAGVVPIRKIELYRRPLWSNRIHTR